MKRIIVTLVFILSSVISDAKYVELGELLYSAKNNDKLILLEIHYSAMSAFSLDSISCVDQFIRTSLYASDPADLAIINEYRVESYPSIVLLNSDGHLLLPVKRIDHPSELEPYMEKALNMKHDSKPLAQFDLEYRNDRMNRASLYEYITKRTSLGLNNSNIIDRYTQLVSPADLLNRKTLMLFIDENSFNIPGTFCSFVEQHQENIKQMLKLGDERFARLTEHSIEYNFRKICADKNESAIRRLVDFKATLSNIDDKELLYDEYLIRYLHANYQPLELVNRTRDYVAAVLKQIDVHENGSKQTGFRSSLRYGAVQIAGAFRLNRAAQHIVEITSAKSILNEALAWNVKAEQLADSNKSDIYETRAYILYKLGKRDEAIELMEKAYTSTSKNKIEQKKDVGCNLIKMKRGEKIY
jgi:tetratricopeptide (TPR) repeat protein